MPRPLELTSGTKPRPAQALGRRDFLALGALAASLPAATTAHAHGSAASLPVGYWDGEGDSGGLRAADALLAGDAGFRKRGIRLSVLGLAGPRPRDLVAVHLLSHTVLPGVQSPVDVLHWGMQSLPTDSIGSISDQVLSAGPDASLRLSLEVRYADEAKKRSYPLLLSSGWMPGAAKLRRGTYALAFERGASAPRWTEHRAWLPQEGLQPQLSAQDCACLLLSVDYAA